MPGFIGFTLRALGRTQKPLGWGWVVAAGGLWALAWGAGATGLSAVVALALWGAGLLAFSATLLARWIHPTLLFPSISMAMSSMAVASVLSLGTGYEHAIDELTAKTQGDAVVTRNGRDFHEYERLAPGLESLDAVEVAVPFVHVEGLAQAKGEDAGAPLSRGMVLRGIAPDVLARSRIFARARKTQGLVPPAPADRERRPGLWMGKGLARGIGAKVGDRVLLTVWSRVARREGGTLHYDFSPRERLFLLDAVFETGDAQLDEGLAVSALSAAQALAHGRAWVTGIDLEWSSTHQASNAERLDAVKAWLAQHGKLCRVSSWRESPERDEQRRRFLGLSAVLSFGLMSASTVSLILGVMVLLRLRTRLFRALFSMGVQRGQLKRLVAALLGASALLALLLFGGWWGLLSTLAPELSFSMEVLGELSLRWLLSARDGLWLLGWLTLSYVGAYFALSRQVLGLGHRG